MRILVTGAFGYLGLALLRELGAHDVLAFGRPPRHPAALSVVPPGVETMTGDLVERAGELVRARVFDAIVHLAGGGGAKQCEADPVRAVRDNVEGTAALVEASRAAGVRRLVFASTIAVYGTFRAPAGPYRESDRAEPDDLYGAVKRAAELVVTSGPPGRGVALRIANVYGAGAGLDLGIAGAVERFARAAATGGEITIYGTGAQRIDYVAVEDVVRAVRLAVEAEAPPPVVNIGGGAPVSIAELAEACREAGARRGTEPKIMREGDPGGKIWPDRSLDIALARTALGWKPSARRADAVADLVRMMAEAPRPEAGA